MSKVGESLLKGAKEALAYVKNTNKRPKKSKLGKELIDALNEAKKKGLVTLQMRKERDIGQEILSGIQEIKEWKQGKKKLKTIRLSLPRENDTAKNKQNLDLTQDKCEESTNIK